MFSPLTIVTGNPKGDIVDIAVNLDKNVYNGETRVSVIVRGIRPSQTDEEKVLAAISLCDKFARGEKLTASQAQMNLKTTPTPANSLKGYLQSGL